MNKYTCGVPKEYCNGSVAPMFSSGIRKNLYKAHSSPQEAFNCHARYLVKVLGYERVGSREFVKGDEPVRVLTKKSKFGGRLRGGKSGQGATAHRATRHMPDDGAGTGGFIASY